MHDESDSVDNFTANSGRMNTASSPPASRVGVYWRVWLGIVTVALLLRFTVFLKISSEHRFGLGITYGLCTWLPIMAVNLIEGSKLISYLREHHREKWEYLTYVPLFGSGGHNGFRTLPWLYSQDDLGDPIVTALKADHRRFIRFMFTVFFSYPIVMPVLIA